MDWLKLNSKGILRGSMAASDNVTQLIWIKFLAMANETRDRDGYLRYAPGHPYSIEYIAEVCHVGVNEVQIAVDDFMDDVRDGMPRVEYTDDGSLKLNNWHKYQDAPPDKEAPPRLKSVLEREAITRRMTNQYPDSAREALGYGFQDTIIKKTGEIIKPNERSESHGEQ